MLDQYAALGALEPTLERMADAVIVTTADRAPPGPRIVLVNDAFTRLTGYSPEDVIGKDPRSLRGFETGCESLFRFRGDLEGRRHSHGKATRLRKDGSEYLVEWQVIPLLDENGAVRHWLSIQRDVTRWQAAEKGYRTAEQSYRQLVENQPDPICRFLPCTTLTFVNRAYADLFRRKPEELVGRRLGEVLSEEDAPAVIAHLASVTPDDPYAQYEHENVRKDGTIRWHLWNTLAFFDDDGNVVSYQSVGTEITRRKEAEEALRESEQRFRDFAISASDWFWEMGADLRFSWFSDKLEAVTGISADHVIGKTRAEMGLPKEGAERWEQHQKDLVAHKPFKNFRYGWWNDGGQRVYVSVNGLPVFGEDGEFRGYRGTGTNITAQVRAHKEAVSAKELLNDAIESICEGFAVFDADDRLVMFNENYRLALPQISHLLVPGTRFKDLFRSFAESGHIRIPGNNPEEWIRKRLEEHRKPGTAREYQTREGHWIEIHEYPTAAGGTVIIRTDVSQRKQAEEAILREKARAENYLAIAANMFVALDAEGRITLANKRACEILDRSGDELIGRNWFETALPEDQRRRAFAEFGRITRSDVGAFSYCESDVLTRSGERRLIAWHKTVLKDMDGRATGTLSCGEDITERKQDEEMLRKLSSAVEHSSSSIVITDTNGAIEYVNPMFTETSGYTPQEVIGQNPRFLKSGVVPDEVYRDLWQTITAGKIWRGELCNKKKNGTLYWDLLAVAPVRDVGGNITHFIATQHDMTEQKLLVRQMAHDATHDALTDLVNRREFERRLERAIACAKERGSHHVLCYLDLDQFKLVNDTAGHAAGDELLKQVRGLLKGKFRGRDTLARLGGDEFGLLLDNCTLERANKISEMVIANLRDYRFFWEGRSFRIGVSIGLVAITAETESTAQAMAQADVACYAAKERGRNRVRVYKAEGAGAARHHSEILRAAAIRNAIEEDRFCLYCQPIVPLSETGDSLVRYEVLVRMIDADGQLVLPGKFIPAAERYGLMGAIDRWVIRNAFRYCAGTFDDSSRVEIAINLSGDSLNDDSFPDFVRKQFSHSRVPAERICFEITETAAIQNINHVTQVITEIRKKGSRFALDDFGIGLSSFDYLKTLPVDYVKIDGRFVRDMVENAVDHAMVSAINEVGHVMGIKTIAEFVHNEAILKRLRALGVDYAQGYAIGAPVPLASIDNEPRPTRH